MKMKGIKRVFAALLFSTSAHAAPNDGHMDGPEGKPDTEKFMNSAEVVDRLNKIRDDALNLNSSAEPKQPKCVRGCNSAPMQQIQDIRQLTMDALIPAMAGGGCIKPKPELSCICRKGTKIRPNGQSGYVPFTLFEMSNWGFQSMRVTEIEQKAEQMIKDLPRYGMLPYQGKVAMDNNDRARRVLEKQGFQYGMVTNPADETIQLALKSLKEFDYNGDNYRARYNATNADMDRWVHGHAFGTLFREMRIPVPFLQDGTLSTHLKSENKRAANWKFHTDRSKAYFYAYDAKSTRSLKDYSEMYDLLEENPDLCLKAAMERGEAPKDLVETVSKSKNYTPCMRYGSFIPFTASTPARSRATSATIGVAKTGKLACALGEDTAPIDMQRDRFMWIGGKGHQSISNYKCTTLDLAFNQFKEANQEDPDNVPFALVHFRYLKGCPEGWSTITCSGRVTNKGCGD